MEPSSHYRQASPLLLCPPLLLSPSKKNAQALPAFAQRGFPKLQGRLIQLSRLHTAKLQGDIVHKDYGITGIHRKWFTTQSAPPPVGAPMGLCSASLRSSWGQ